MPRTRFWRGFWYAVAIAGVVAMAAGGIGGEAWFARDLVVGLLTFGFFALLVGGIFGATLHGQLRQYAKLRRGEDVLAKWRVDPDTWQAFVQQEREWRDAGFVPNELAIPAKVPAAGVEVIVGRGAVLVGDSLHVIPEHGNPEVLSALLDDSRLRNSFVALELLHHATRAGHASTRTSLRFPVADGSLAAARAVTAHFARETPQRPSFMHGPGDGTDPEDETRCWSCGHVTHKLVTACPRCGASMQSKRWARRLGGVLVVLGALLAGGVGFLTWLLWPALTSAAGGTGSVRFNGSPGQARLILALFAAVTTFGAPAFSYGVFQVVTGRRSQRFAKVAGAVIAIAALLAWAVAR